MPNAISSLFPHSLLLTLTAGIAAQVPSWSPDWAVAGLGGTVFSLTDYGGEIVAGGRWFAAKGGVIKGLARYDGTAWRELAGGVDLVNYSFPPRFTQVLAMTQFQGELVFAGTFDRVGTQAIDYIARWDGTTVRPLGTGLRLTFDEAEIRGLAVFNNELYAVGDFDQAGGVAVAGIARWNGTTWSAVGAGLRDSVSGSIGFGRSACAHGGALYVGGTFDRAGGLPANNIARWNGSAWSAVGTGSFAPVYALESYAGQLVAAGQFQIGGGNVAMPGAWNGSTWSAMGNNAPTVPSVALRAVGPDLYADVGQTVARYDGTTWSTVGRFSGIFSGFEGTSVRALHAIGAAVLAGGEFTQIGVVANEPQVASANIALLVGGTQWIGLGTGLGLDRRFDRLYPWRNGWVASGSFSEAGGAPAVGLAFFDGDRWQSLGRFSGGLGSGPVYDIAVWQGDLIVTGDFAQIDGQPFPGIARHDGTQWRPFGTQRRLFLHTHVSDLYAFGGNLLERWNGSAFATVASVPAGSIDKLCSHGNLLVAIVQDAFNHRVMTWNGSQLVQVGTANDLILAVASIGGNVVIGGRFTNAGGVAANLIARWNGAWSAFPAPVTGYSANSFGELDGETYLGISGDPRGYVLRLAGATWQPLLPAPVGTPMTFFADRAVDSILMSGDIIAAGTLPVRSVLEWQKQPDWRNRLHGTAGAAGVPLLMGRGSTQRGSTLTWTIEGPPSLPVLFGAGTTRLDLPLFGALLVPQPDELRVLATDASGTATLSLQVPATMPPGILGWSQAWLVDPTGPQGFTATNALECTVR